MTRKIIRNRKLDVFLYLALGICSSFIAMVSVTCYENILDNLTGGKLPAVSLALYAVSTIAVFILNYLCMAPGTRLSSGMFLDYKILAIEKISHMRYEEYQKIGTGKILQIVQNGANAGKYIYYDFYFRVAREIIPDVIFSMIFIWFINKKIMFLILVGYIVVFAVTNILLKTLYSIKEKLQFDEESLNKYITRGLMEFVVFRVNKLYRKEIEKISELSDDITKSKTTIVMVHEAFFTIFAILIGIIKVVIIYLAFYNIGISVGALVALLTLVDKAYNPIAIFNVIYVQKKLEQISYDRYKEVLNAAEDGALVLGADTDDIKEKQFVLDKVNVKLEQQKILENVSVKFPIGCSIALIGESGSGKSTILKVLLGLIKTHSGNVYFGNRKLEEICLNDLYDEVVYLGQETPVFDGTLRENIALDKKVTDEEINQILEKVCLTELVEKMPNALESEIGEKGVALSGGERQRVALARLFVKKPNIIILDEATSALDGVTEEKVMKNIYSEFCNITIIIVAHRLEVIKSVDKIITLKNGNIVSEGNFDSLIKSDTYFQELWNTYKNEDGFRDKANSEK